MVVCRSACTVPVLLYFKFAQAAAFLVLMLMLVALVHVVLAVLVVLLVLLALLLLLCLCSGGVQFRRVLMLVPLVTVLVLTAGAARE